MSVESESGKFLERIQKLSPKRLALLAAELERQLAARETNTVEPIAVVGLRDSILVQTDDAVMLAHKSQAQKVKELVKRLAEDPQLKKLV